MQIIAAIAICTIGAVQPGHCDNRTANRIVFTPSVYDEHTMPTVCFRESMAYVLSRGEVGRREFAQVHCGRVERIRSAFMPSI